MSAQRQALGKFQLVIFKIHRKFSFPLIIPGSNHIGMIDNIGGVLDLYFNIPSSSL